MIEEFAPAKVNLSLHVTGQRGDGYHLLDSLVVFVDIGDRLTFEPSNSLSIEVSGTRAKGVPTDSSNLILKAARLFDGSRGAKIALDKQLPAAAGIGGGSSDAAAALRGLARLWGVECPEDPLALGADVPVCLRARSTWMRGIGEDLSDVPTLPETWLVLTNPGVAIETPSVFERLTNKNQAPMSDLPKVGSAQELADWLGETRNDLQQPAIEIAPVVGLAIDLMAKQSGCLIARMSGSGATCWGMFGSKHEADAAAANLQAMRPDWWSVATKIEPLS